MDKIENKFWAIIPARSGSKSIKNKNLRKLGDLSLIEHAIKSAKSIDKIDKIVFSSDSLKYIKLAKKSGVDILHHRSANASQDGSKDIDFFKDFIKSNKIGHLPRYFIHLRPTSPLRESSILNLAVSNFVKKNKNFSSMRSVTKMSESSFKTFIIKNSKLCSLNKNFNLDFYNNPKEKFAETYYPNGYIDIIKTSNILKGFMHGNKVLPFVIKNKVVDIDNYDDLSYAKYLYKLKNDNSK